MPRSIVWICIGVGLLALVLRFTLLAEIVRQNPPDAIDRFGGDSRQYVDLAKNLVELGRFADDGPGARPAGTTYFSLLRPPAYPLVIAAFERVGWRSGVIWAQGVAGALLPALITLLAFDFFRSRIIAASVGVVAALSPTGIGIPGLILADLPFAAMFAIAFGMLVWACSSTRASLYWLAGALFGVASLIKPAGLYWVLVLPVVTWLLAKAFERRVRWGHQLGAIALCLGMMGTWAARNYVLAGRFAVSTVDAQNLRFYLAPQVEEWARAGEAPTKGAVKKNRTAVMKRDQDDLQHMPAGEIVARQWAESVAIFKANPRATLAAYWENVQNHLTTPFNHFDYELPNGGFVRESLAKGETVANSNAVFHTGWVLLVVALALPWINPNRDVAWRRRYLGTLAIVITYAYLIVFIGTTYATGSRIVFASQFAGLLIAAAGMVSVLVDIRARFTANPTPSTVQEE